MAASAPQIPSMPAGAHVQVNLPHIGLLPATVDSVQGDVVVAVLAVGDSRVKRLEGAEVAIEHATGRGINRYGGRLQLDGARPEELHVTLVGGAGGAGKVRGRRPPARRGGDPPPARPRGARRFRARAVPPPALGRPRRG